MSDGKVLYGQQYFPTEDAVVSFTEQEQNFVPGTQAASVGTARTDVRPTDRAASKVITWASQSALYSTLKSDYTLKPTFINLDLPDELTSVTVTYNISSGSGTSSFPAANQISRFTGTSGSVSVNPRANCQASVAILPEVSFVRKPYSIWGRNVSAVQYSFFVVDTAGTADHLRARATRFAVTGQTCTVTIATPAVFTATAHGFINTNQVMLTTTGALPTGFVEDSIYFIVSAATDTFRLSLTSGGSAINSTGTQSGVHTVRRVLLARLVFRPKPHQFSLNGQKFSGALNNETSLRISVSSTQSEADQMYGGGSSSETGVTITTVDLPPMIHGTITPTGNTTTTQSATLTTNASSMLVSGTVGSYYESLGPITNTGSLTISATGSVVYDALTSTPPTTTIPTSGVYAWDFRTENAFQGLLFVAVDVVDFSYFA